MATDWALIREVMTAAIDACEASEHLGLNEEDRGLPTGTDGVVVWDVLSSAWTYPENLRYSVIRARHRLGDDAPYPPELARVLREVGAVCAELVGAKRLDEPLGADERAESMRTMVRGLPKSYREQMVPQLGRAASSKRNEGDGWVGPGSANG